MEYELEQLVDQTSLHHVLSVLEDICHGKAEHILQTWQDPSLARGWQKAARALNYVAIHLPNVPGVV